MRIQQKNPEALEALACNFVPQKYKDADLRAAAAEKFFRKVLGIENVKILRNLSREEMIEVFNQQERQANEFERSQDYDTQAVNAVFVNYIGFKLHDSTTPFVKEHIDWRIFPP